MAQVHFRHTRDVSHSFSILLSPRSSPWKNSCTSAPGFPNLRCLTLCQVTLSPHLVPSALFFTRGYGLDSWPHSVLHTSLPGQGLHVPSFAPPHPQFIPAALVHLLFCFLTLSPTKLCCALAVYIMPCLSVSSPHFSLWQEKRQFIFQFKAYFFFCSRGFAAFFWRKFFKKEEERSSRENTLPMFLSLQTVNSRASWSNLDPPLLFGLPRCMAF